MVRRAIASSPTLSVHSSEVQPQPPVISVYTLSSFVPVIASMQRCEATETESPIEVEDEEVSVVLCTGELVHLPMTRGKTIFVYTQSAPTFSPSDTIPNISTLRNFQN